MTEVFKLRRFLDLRGQVPSKAAVCELCGAPLAEAHGHVMDAPNHRLMCCCRPCYLLFTHGGAAGGKLRSIPERRAKISDGAFGTIWERLEIPVGVAFFMRNTAQSRVVAFYPSPGGATESVFPVDAWDQMTDAAPVLATLEPDVEALLVCRQRGRSESWIVPIDACYELVGRIRRSWKGIDGGDRAWSEIDSFFARLVEITP